MIYHSKTICNDKKCVNKTQNDTFLFPTFPTKVNSFIYKGLISFFLLEIMWICWKVLETAFPFPTLSNRIKVHKTANLLIFNFVGLLEIGFSFSL